MKSYVFLFSILAFACSTNPDFNQAHKSDLQNANLNGDVWKVRKTIHVVGGQCKCPAAERNECNQALYTYNKSGNLIETCDIDDNGEIDFTYKYSYTRKQICSGIEKYAGNKLMGKEVNVIRGNHVVEVKVFDELGDYETGYKYAYSNDKVSDGMTFNSEGEVVTTFINEYADGLLVSQTEKDNSGEIKRVIRYKWNDKKDKIETRTTIPRSKSDFTLTFEYEYDHMNNWIKQKQLYDGEIIQIVMRDIQYHSESENEITENL